MILTSTTTTTKTTLPVLMEMRQKRSYSITTTTLTTTTTTISTTPPLLLLLPKRTKMGPSIYQKVCLHKENNCFQKIITTPPSQRQTITYLFLSSIPSFPSPLFLFSSFPLLLFLFLYLLATIITKGYIRELEGYISEEEHKKIMKDIQQTHHNYVNFLRNYKKLLLMVCVVVFCCRLFMLFKQFSP